MQDLHGDDDPWLQDLPIAGALLLTYWTAYRGADMGFKNEGLILLQNVSVTTFFIIQQVKNPFLK